MTCAWIVWNRSLSPSNHPRPDHAPIVIVIQSERLKHSTSPRNQSAKHPDSGRLGISGVVIGSALSKGSRSGPEAFRAGHFEDSKPETTHEKPLAPRVSAQRCRSTNRTCILTPDLRPIRENAESARFKKSVAVQKIFVSRADTFKENSKEPERCRCSCCTK